MHVGTRTIKLVETQACVNRHKHSSRTPALERSKAKRNRAFVPQRQNRTTRRKPSRNGLYWVVATTRPAVPPLGGERSERRGGLPPPPTPKASPKGKPGQASKPLRRYPRVAVFVGFLRSKSGRGYRSAKRFACNGGRR